MPVTAAVAGAVADASSSVINNAVNTLAQNKVYKAKIEQMQLQGKIAQLDNQQKYELAIKLQNANNASELFKIIQDTTARISVQGVDSSGDIYETALKLSVTNNRTTAIIIGSSLLALIIAGYFLTKK